MIGSRKRQLTLGLGYGLLLSALCPRQCGAAEGSAPAAEAGETLLSAVEVDKVLAELPVFKNQDCIKARIVSQWEDLLGPRKDEGELFLDRPMRILRKFTKPSLKLWLMEGAQLQEYAPANKVLYIKDFSAAPRKLKLVRAFFSADIKTLSESFDVWVFRHEGERKDQPVCYRFVLMNKPGPEKVLECKSMQARVYENALFFHEIQFVPKRKEESSTLERYFDIASVPKPSDQDFHELLGLPADVVRKLEPIDGDAKKR